MRKLGYKKSVLGRYNPAVTRRTVVENGEEREIVKEVYLRPQQSSGVKYELDRNIRNYETHSTHIRSFDNPNVNLLKSFDAKEDGNKIVTRNLVCAFNYPHRGGKTAEQQKANLARCRREYQRAFEDFNLCWRCRKPLKVKTASIMPKSEPRDLNDGSTIKGKVVLPPSVEYAEKLGWSDRDFEQVIKRHHRPSKSLGEHWKPYEGVKTVQYADVISHFEYRLHPDGRAYYVFVDGTSRNIQLKREEITYYRKKRGKHVPRKHVKTFFAEVFPDGSYKECMVQNSYRVLNQKCGCKKAAVMGR